MVKIEKPTIYNICALGALEGITEMNQRAFDIRTVLGSQYQYRPFI